MGHWDKSVTPATNLACVEDTRKHGGAYKQLYALKKVIYIADIIFKNFFKSFCNDLP